MNIDQFWEEQIVPTLKTYIEIPAKSPSFDPDWKSSGHIDRALKLVQDWVTSQNVPGLKMQVFEEPGRTPLLFLELEGTHDQQVLMYGHLDKQPEMSGWSDGLEPWKAVRRGEKLYGRGGADDGYAVFACICAIKELLRNNSPRPHLRILIEFSEESGSTDLPFYFEKYADEFGTPALVICLDSGAGNYEQFWTTTSLRGLISGILRVEVLKEGVHSGDASGVVPSSFRIAREVLSRIENIKTGEVKLPAVKAKVPKERQAQIKRAAKALGREVYTKFPFTGQMLPATRDIRELILNRTWRAALSVTGAEGLPEPRKAGNVLRPFTALKLSLRLPPTVDAAKAAKQLKKVLEKNPPYKAKVKFEIDDKAGGWDAPAMKPSLAKLIQESSRKFFGREALAMGEGGTIPFMGMLGDKFPKAQFVITGVLGPGSNAHGPNEFIHIEYAKKLNACIAHILASSQQIR
jgi:acetylornithine deacetylase/succinyl-diaminopimelate desuccinylase-like protein